MVPPVPICVQAARSELRPFATASQRLFSPTPARPEAVELVVDVSEPAPPPWLPPALVGSLPLAVLFLRSLGIRRALALLGLATAAAWCLLVLLNAVATFFATGHLLAILGIEKWIAPLELPLTTVAIWACMETLAKILREREA